MLPRAWEIKDKNPKDIIKSLLKNRGIEDTQGFLHPTHPLDFTYKELGLSESDMKKAVKRILDAKSHEETVVIYGDYDVDGTCATALLWSTLHSAGLKVFPFIPDRFSDGYGVSSAGLEKIYEKYPQVKLIITVDNGIVAEAAIKEAQARGISVIVTDHHEASGKNSADVIIHSTLMCGTALAWCLSGKFSTPEVQRENLDLVGLATIADQMKLVGINRSFALHGIQAIKDSKRIGLRILCESAQIELSGVGTYEIGYILGPRLNAAGRLSHAIDVVRLLCTKKITQAYEIASSLTELNVRRQDITSSVLASAREQSKLSEKVILVVGAFHEGVIGLAAGKLVEETGHPAIVFSEGETRLKGSARSIPGFNITEALRVFEDLFVNVGGHEMAAGLTIEKKNLSTFLEKFTKHTEETLSENLFSKTLHIDCQIPFSPISAVLFEEINHLEPFGNGNPKPLFMTSNTEVISVKRMGSKAEHIKFFLKEGGVSFEAVLFRADQWENVPKLGAFIDVVYSIDENSWNGRSSIQLLIKDFHIHDKHSKTNRKGISKTQKLASKRE